VRSDLPHGVQVAQTAHAAGESAGGPLPEGTIVVALAVPDEPTLLGLRRAFALAQLDHKLIVENDGPWADQAMAIGVKPTTNRAAVRKVVSALPLVR
jgi:hypothetical protein